jgi:hypothetical protein
MQENLQREVQGSLEYHYEKIDTLASQSKLMFDSSQVGQDDNPLHIDFSIASREPAVAIRYINFLRHELCLQYHDQKGEYCDYGVEECKSALRVEITMESKVAGLRDALIRGKAEEQNGLIMQEQAIPCILHLENRVSEKILYVMLQQAVTRYGNGSRRRRHALANAIEHVIQTQVLGTPTQPSQWTFPWDEEERNVHPRNVNNTIARKCIMRIDVILATAFSEPFDKRKNAAARQRNEGKGLQWRALGAKYMELMEFTRQKEDFTILSCTMIYI